MEERTLRCPNCGANATNHDNCEYCGSLLVRFVEKGIDLSKTTYLNDDATFLGLTNALKNNLQLQEGTDETVVTDIVGIIGDETRKSYLACILRNGMASYMDGQDIPTKTNKGLCVSFSFDFYLEGMGWHNQKEEKRLYRFKSLDCFPLFTEHLSFYDKGSMKAYEYSIDFGEDAEGASRLISRILHEIYELPMERHVDCYTNAGHYNIERCRKGIDQEIEKSKVVRKVLTKKIKEEPSVKVKKMLKDPWYWIYAIMILLCVLAFMFGMS